MLKFMVFTVVFILCFRLNKNQFPESVKKWKLMRKGKKDVSLEWIQLSFYQYGAVLFRIKRIKTLFINDNVSDNESDNSYLSLAVHIPNIYRFLGLNLSVNSIEFRFGVRKTPDDFMQDLSVILDFPIVLDIKLRLIGDREFWITCRVFALSPGVYLLFSPILIRFIRNELWSFV